MSVKFVLQSATIGIVLVVGILTGTLGARHSLAHSADNSMSVHKYKTNARGETYGSDAWIPGGTVGLSDEPDLIKAQATNGKIGYVKSSDLFGSMPKTPQEAVALDAQNKKPRTIPVYASDSTTIIGSFAIASKQKEYTAPQTTAMNGH